MARFALVRANDTVDRISTQVDPNVQTKTGWRWLPCDPVAPPSFDPQTEKVTGPTYTVGASAVTEVWTKVSLSAQEISDAKDIAISGISGTAFSALFKVLFNLNNRVRVLEGQSALTQVQFRAAIKALI